MNRGSNRKFGRPAKRSELALTIFMAMENAPILAETLCRFPRLFRLIWILVLVRSLLPPILPIPSIIPMPSISQGMESRIVAFPTSNRQGIRLIDPNYNSSAKAESIRPIRWFRLIFISYLFGAGLIGAIQINRFLGYRQKP